MIAVGGRTGERKLSAGGVFQKGAQRRNALGARFGEIDLLGRNGAEHQHLAPCAGHRNIEPPPAALPVERSEVHIDLAVLVGAVADGEQDHVAFVALHVFKIFDENRFLSFVEPFFKALVGGTGVVEQVVDQVLLGNIEGDNTDALFVQLAVLIASLDFGDDRLRLSEVAAVRTALKYALDLHEIHLALAVVDGREGVELVLIELAVAECNQALVTAAIMPEQMCLRHIERKAVVKNALEILNVEVVLIDGIRGKERGRRHLLGVADNYGVLTAGEYTDRLAGGKL